MKKQQMVLLIARANLDPKFVYPLQIIIPALVLAAPFSLYTSLCHKIQGENLYDALWNNLTTTGGVSSLTETLRMILRDRVNASNFRVCILGGQKCDWDIVLEYKRKKIMIDTAIVSSISLNQVSYTTGGISKEINDNDMIRQFLQIFSMSKSTRNYFMQEQNKKVSFSLECNLCQSKHPMSQNFCVCSVCLLVFCKQRSVLIGVCPRCESQYDIQSKNSPQQ